MDHRPTIAAGLALLTVVTSTAPFARAGQAPRVAHRPRVVAARGPSAGVEGGVRLVAASPLTSTATPRPSPTGMPTIDPTPYGSPVAIRVDAPLPTPALAADAITAANAFEVAEVARLTSPTDGVELFGQFAPGARALFSVTGAGLLVARSLPDGEILWRQAVWPDSGGPRMAVSPDGRTLATSWGGPLELWDAATGAPLRRHVVGREVWEVSFADDGRRLAALSRDGWAAAWDVAGGSLLADRQVAPFADLSPRLRPGAAEVSAIRWGVNALTVWDILTGLSRWSVSPPAGSGTETGNRSAWSRNGRFLLWTVTGGQRAGDQWVCRSDLSAAPTCAPLAIYGSFVAIGPSWRLFVSNGGLIVAAGERQSHLGVCQQFGVDVWDGNGPMRTVFDAPGRRIDDVDVSPDGTLLAIGHGACTGSTPNEIALVAIGTGQVVARLSGVTLPRFTPDGSRLVTQAFTTMSGQLRLFGVVPGSGKGRRVFLPVGWARR